MGKLDRFWSSYKNLDGPPSPNLVGKLKISGNAFFESEAPINREQIEDILDKLVDYPNLRFIKIKAPNIKKAFNSTPEAEEYLKRLVYRTQRRN